MTNRKPQKKLKVVQQQTNRLSSNNFSLADRFSSSLIGRGKKELGYKLLLKSLLVSRRSHVFASLQRPETMDALNLYGTSLGSHQRAHLEKKPKPPNADKRAAKQEILEIRRVASICKKAISNIKPIVETRKVRKGGATYQVPFVLEKQRQEGVAVRWLIESISRRRHNVPQADASSRRTAHANKKVCALSLQFLDALKSVGHSVDKRNQTHQLALNNRAYTHYRWW